MPEFRIEAMSSRKLNSDKVVYYVNNINQKKLATKFDTNTLKPEEIEGLENFTLTQKLELQNYLANVRFTMDKLQLPAKMNRDYRLALPVPLQEALIELFTKASVHNIKFDPMSAMLNGLLNHIETTQKRLNAFDEPSVLSQFDLHLSDTKKTENDKEIKKISKKIFKHLLLMRGGLEKYAKAARELYGKETNLNSATIAKYAEGEAKPSKWSISCALTVLGDKEDIATIVSIPMLILLWLVPLKFSGKLQTTEQVLSLFQSTFKLDTKAHQEAAHFIELEMNKIT